MRFGWFGFGSGALADADGMGEVAVAAERLGFESLWVGEHPVLIDPHEPPSPLPSRSEMMDPIPALAFAAARTERIRLGTGIVILPLRNPVTLAKELATIDVLSRGRLMVGIGVGYVRGEYEAMGVPFNTRGRRADEYVDALRVLWGEEQPSFQGDFVSFDGIQCRPQPMQRPGPPILASGMSIAARRRAVMRAEGWYGFFLDVDQTGAAVDELARLHKEVDRHPDLGVLEVTITPPPWNPLDIDAVRRFEDLGVDRLVLMRDFADMSGGPDEALRAAILDDMTAVAERFGLS